MVIVDHRDDNLDCQVIGICAGQRRQTDFPMQLTGGGSDFVCSATGSSVQHDCQQRWLLALRVGHQRKSESANGVVMLSRAGGRITLKNVFPVEAGPTGMIMTHDGKLLIVADAEYVVLWM